MYRWCGEPTPLHADAGVAAAAGFAARAARALRLRDGLAGRAAALRREPGRIGAFGARFAAPVFPGDTLSIDLWMESTEVLFEASAMERCRRVLFAGRALPSGP